MPKKMSLPNLDLTTENIRKIEDEILLLARHCQTYDEIMSAGTTVWDWSAKVLKMEIDDLRGEVETHALDEKYPDKFQEEKDHLLKIPLVLLDHLHHPNI